MVVRKKLGDLTLKEWSDDLNTYSRQLDLSNEDKLNVAIDHLLIKLNIPTATIIIGRVPAMCVLDTGAETSLISLDFYSKHLAQNVGKLDDMGKFIRLFGANNLEIPIDGYLETEVEIMGHNLMASFVVSHAGDHSNAVNTGSRSPILLGCNVHSVF